MARKLEVEIVGDARSLNRALSSAESSTKGLGQKFSRLGKTAGFAAGAAGIGALVYTIKTGISEFSQQQKVAAQTNAVLKSTGAVAGVSAKHVDALAQSLMKKSGTDDEAIASGENLLLTFTKIRNEAGKGNDVFDQATKVALDLSVALGKDMASSSILVGKALNDPIKGITSLGRAGVQFTAGQKETIKSLVETGHTLDAQKLILAELNTQVGGSAAAFGKTLPGEIAIAKQAFANWTGELVAKTIPVLQQTIGWLRDHWPEISAALSSMWASAKPVLVEFGATAAATAGLIRKHWGTIGPIVTQVANVIKAQCAIIVQSLRTVNSVLNGEWSASWGNARSVGVAAAKVVTLEIRTWFSIARAVIMGVVDALTSLVRALHFKITKPQGLDALVSAFGAVRSAIEAVISAVERLISALGRVKVPSIHLPKLPGGGGLLDRLRADGGPVSSMTPYIVGERGPEWFVPSRSGTIVPNGGSMGRPMQVLLQLDSRTVASVLVDPLRGEIRQLQRAGGRF